jgi:hypothetical protein
VKFALPDADDAECTPAADPAALIREARQRQRRRYIVAGVAVGIVVAGVASAAAMVGGSRAGGRARVSGDADITTRAHPASPAPGLTLPGVATAVVVWPIGYPYFTATGGPPAYVLELDSGRHWLRQIPHIIGCDCRPYLIGVGGRLIYAGSGGTTAISARLTGKPRVLGATQFFVPSASRRHVWLIRYSHGYERPGPVFAKSASVTGGQVGPKLTLPRRTATVIRGTDSGFLLQLSRPNRRYGLALWRPGSPPRPVPHSPADSISAGFDASARFIAYGLGCHIRETTRNAGSFGYYLCSKLGVLDVRTGELRSFASPPGTTGWVPSGFNLTSAISPAQTMIAAYAGLPPRDQGRSRLYVLPLAGPGGQAIPVPSSAGFLNASTAWTASGSWLLYRGSGKHLWAYQVRSGTVRSSRSPFSGIVAVPAGRTAP